MGFSQFMKINNLDYDCWFKENINDYLEKNLKLFKKKIKNFFFKKIKTNKKNPTHFYSKNILKNYGIIKIDLIKTNPHKIDLTSIKKILGKKNLILLN